MSTSIQSMILKGAMAGVTGSLVQAIVGKAHELLFLPPGEDADLAPRLVERVGEEAGVRPTEEEKWVLGTAFHFGYGGFWGAAYAAARERTSVHPLAGGALLGGLIYLITFPPWGGGVQTGTVRHPRNRSDSMTVFGVAVTLSFGVTTAVVYEALVREEAGGTARR